MTHPLLLSFALFFAAGVSGVSASTSGSELSSPAFSSPEVIEQRLADVRTQRQQLAPATDFARSQLLQRLEVALLQHLEAGEYLDQMRHEAERLREVLRGWKGLEAPPPYTVQFVDELHTRHRSLENQLAATHSRLRIIGQLDEQITNQLDEHQKALRRYHEEADLAAAPEVRRVAEAAAIIEEIASRISTETLARLHLRRSAHEIQAAALASALELSELKIAAARGQVRFMPGELKTLQQGIVREREELLAEVLGDGGDIGSPRRQVSWMLDILDIEEQFWNALYAALNATETAEREAAVTAMHGLKRRLDDWMELIGLNIQEAATGTAETLGAQATNQDLERVADLRSRVEFALQELGDEGIRGRNLFQRAWSGLQAIWAMELYLAEETASVAGERVTTYRAVTIGKILRLIFILTVGWLVLRFLSRRLHALLLRRPDADPAQADLARNWAFGIGLALLIIYGLNRVHIPFTAFAFLGGTLAIGIGFGAQTILKNFISGVILSLERPFKVGDLVEVEEIMGNIVRIGLRASVIRHFDGTDTLVPNSTLLENRVSNWTYGDSAMRGRIEVGVAYGSPKREVTRLLLVVADEHGLVLKQPEPTVQFDSFGDNALQFSLLYWFARSTGQRPALHDRPHIRRRRHRHSLSPT